MPFIGDEGGPLHHLNHSGFGHYLGQGRQAGGFDAGDRLWAPHAMAPGEHEGGLEMRKLVRQVASVRAAISQYLDRNPHLASGTGPSDTALGEVAQQIDRFRAAVGRVSGQNHTIAAETARLLDVTLKLLRGATGRG